MKKVYRVLALVLAGIVIFAAILHSGVGIMHMSLADRPEYPKTDITSILNKKELTEEDYNTLLMQTGLYKTAVDELRSMGDAQRILKIQRDFFADYKINTEIFAPFTCYHDMDAFITTAPLENGDIILSPTTHLSFFELGHAALVVDAENGYVLNSTGYGQDSCIEPIEEITCRPRFIVLRPKLSKEERQRAVDNALEMLKGLPYSISVGILSSKYAETPDRTHCSHIIWYAYKTVGLDLDSDGGAVVFPSDIENSECVEKIQAYGIKLD